MMTHPNKIFMQQLSATTVALALLALSPAAHSAETIMEALTDGKTSANLQYRYESIRNPGKASPNSANAQTVRLRLGYETGTLNGFNAMVEAETLTALGNKNYDSKATSHTANGYAVVVDPEATEINQAYLSYSSFANTTAKWGRQRIKLNNERFIGNVGWRQNEQTFDAFRLDNTSLPSTTITATYITNVNRVFGDNAAAGNGGVAATAGFAGNHKMKSTILNANYRGLEFAEVVVYTYLLDYDSTTAFTANTTNTYGIRLNGNTPMDNSKLLYTAEFASQSDGGNNPVDYKANYTLLEGGIGIKGMVFKLGYEVLGVDTGAITKATSAVIPKSFSTPLATLHAFNGWADMFLTTPAQGLRDIYVSTGAELADIKLGALYHDFRADKSTATIGSYGTEWDIVATRNFGKNYILGGKYATYKTKNLAIGTNTDKLWLWGEVKF